MLPLFLPSNVVEAAWSFVVWLSAWLLLFFSISNVLRFWFVGNPSFRNLKNQNLDLELTERVVSSLHAFAVVVVVTISYYLDNTSSDRSILLRDGSPIVLSVLMPSTAWFVVDILYTLYMGYYVWSRNSALVFDLLHHGVAIFAEVQFLASQNLRAQILAQVCRLLLLTEVTTPFINLRWILIKFKANSVHIFYTSLLILLGFLVFRDANCCFMLFVMIHFGLSDMADISVADTVTDFVTTCCMGMLNVYWTYLMVHRAILVLRGNKQALHVAESSKLNQQQHQPLYDDNGGGDVENAKSTTQSSLKSKVQGNDYGAT